MNFIIAQILGAVGYSLLAYSYFKKEKKEILFIQILAYIGFTTHYFLLSAKTGTICNILGFLAIIFIYILSDNKKYKKILVMILIPILLAITYYSYENIYSLFPVFACFITFLSFLNKDENIIRFIGIISAVCWLVYAIIYISYSAIIFEIIIIISSIVAFIKNKNHK